jgi:ferredoxin
VADRDSKWENNCPGRYYVDRNCISAKYCVSVAPELFSMGDGGDHAAVVRQPENAAEEELARDALNGCPVNAIGDDGDGDPS